MTSRLSSPGDAKAGRRSLGARLRLHGDERFLRRLRRAGGHPTASSSLAPIFSPPPTLTSWAATRTRSVSAGACGSDGRFIGVKGRPDYVRAACEASLKRLKLEAINLYYLHTWTPTRPSRTQSGQRGTRAAGKVRYLRLSEAAPGARRVRPIAALQTEYSLMSREPEGELFDTALR